MKYNKLKKIVFFLLLALNTTLTFGQITSIELGVNGLTCSQCSRSVEMELRKIPFVRDVKMNLKHTNAQVYFKQGSTIDLKQLPRAVKDAGFSMRYLDVSFNFTNIRPTANCFQLQHTAFYFLTPLPKTHKEIMVFQVIGKGFLPRKEFLKYDTKKTGACHGRESYFLKEINKS